MISVNHAYSKEIQFKKDKILLNNNIKNKCNFILITKIYQKKW